MAFILMSLKNIQNEIKKAQIKNDQRAFSKLFYCYWDDVFQFQMKYVGDGIIAEEISILTFTKAFNKILIYDLKYPFKSWLFQIAKNVSIDYFRSKNAQKLKCINIQSIEEEQNFILDQNKNPEEKMIFSQKITTLFQQIKTLPQHHQVALEMRYIKELSYKEIAQILQTNINVIKVKIFRAKKHLLKINNR